MTNESHVNGRTLLVECPACLNKRLKPECLVCLNSGLVTEWTAFEYRHHATKDEKHGDA